jgi:hypothetical protein
MFKDFKYCIILMDPNVWGPPAWEFIFSVIDTMPDGDPPDGYLAFFHSFIDVLPCAVCRKHYRKHIMANPIPIKSRRLTRKYFEDLRLEIAVRKGKWPRKKFLGIF